MNTDKLIPLGSLAVAATSLFYTWWKNRATSESNLRIINAEIRAEEALQIAKAIDERDRLKFEREKAEIDAPQIADRWATEIGFCWKDRTKNGVYELTKPVKSLAERQAVEILRNSQDSLNLLGVLFNEDTQVCTISGWNMHGYKRHMQKIGEPPKLKRSR